jgi:hypothetical protein
MRMTPRDGITLATTVALVWAALVLIFVAGCAGPALPADDVDITGPRPHSLTVTERLDGTTITCHSGDVVELVLPCSGGKCYTRATSGLPHMVNTDNDDGVFRFRAAAPGQCVLRFSGRKNLEFKFVVRP